MNTTINISISNRQILNPGVAEALSTLMLALGDAKHKNLPQGKPWLGPQTTEQTKERRSLPPKWERVVVPPAKEEVLTRVQTRTARQLNMLRALETGDDLLDGPIGRHIPVMHPKTDYGPLQGRFLDYVLALGPLDKKSAQGAIRQACHDIGVEFRGPKSLGGVTGSLAKWAKKNHTQNPLIRTEEGYEIG